MSMTQATLHESRETIDPRGSVMEQLGFVRSGVVGGQAFERVPQHHIAAADFVNREVRLEHTPVDTEFVDGELVVAPRGVRKLRTRRWLRAFVPTETVDLHVDPAELGDHIRTCGKLTDRSPPLRIDRVR